MGQQTSARQQQCRRRVAEEAERVQRVRHPRLEARATPRPTILAGASLLLQLQQRRVFQNVFFSVTLGISGGWLLVILFVLTSSICPPWFCYKRDLWLPAGFVIDRVADIDD